MPGCRLKLRRRRGPPGVPPSVLYPLPLKALYPLAKLASLGATLLPLMADRSTPCNGSPRPAEYESDIAHHAVCATDGGLGPLDEQQAVLRADLTSRKSQFYDTRPWRHPRHLRRVLIEGVQRPRAGVAQADVHVSTIGLVLMPQRSIRGPAQAGTRPRAREDTASAAVSPSARISTKFVVSKAAVQCESIMCTNGVHIQPPDIVLGSQLQPAHHGGSGAAIDQHRDQNDEERDHQQHVCHRRYIPTLCNVSIQAARILHSLGTWLPEPGVHTLATWCTQAVSQCCE